MAAIAYAVVAGNDVAVEGLDEQETIAQSLAWVGFTIENQRQRLMDESMGIFQEIRLLDSDDIDAMAKDYASRPAANGKMTFGMNRTKRLKAFVYWVQDFHRISTTPTVTGLNEAAFRADLLKASIRAEVRVNLHKQTKTAAEAASPGPLESERKWKQWEERFINYTRKQVTIRQQ